MSTHARIGIMLYDGTIKHSYCHFDGYPDGVGQTLVANYNTVDSINELLSFGDMSYLTSELHPEGEHTFNNPEEGVTVFYNRDRGEDGVDAVITSMDELHNIYSSSVDYFYLYVNNVWQVYNVYEKDDWKLVKEFLPEYTLTTEDIACKL